jgi:Mn-dependent DtxR family transcriptional regulator
MNKREAIAYLRKRALLERLAVTIDPNPEAAEELAEMEKSHEKNKKNLTTDPSNV